MIAVAASLSAGCLPCIAYHARAVREAGASESEARWAAAIGLAVKRESLAIMSGRAAEYFGLREEEFASISTDENAPLAALVAIASAVAAHCVPALERHLAAAHNLNITEADVKRAVGIGRQVRETAASNVDEGANLAGEASPAAPCAAPTPSPTPPSNPCCQA